MAGRLSLWLAAAALALSSGAASAQGRPAMVGIETVSTMEMAETVAVFGEVVSGRQSRVAARVAGIAADVPLRVGDRVSEGDLLARIDTELFEIGLAQAQAEIVIAEAGIATVEARLERAQNALSRAESLIENSAIAEAQLEDRRTEFAEVLGARQEARARIDAARTALRRSEYEVTNATIRAPFDGVVVDVATELGQFVAAGSEIATLVDTGAMEVEANVPARFVAALAPDLEVSGMADAGGALVLRLRAILPTEFSSTRTRPVRFDLMASDAPSAVGQSVTLQIPVSAPREVVAVPKDALIQARGGWSVFVAADGKAQPRTVEIGAALGDRFEVVSGLAEGDVVVVRGNERLRPGQDIMPQPNAAPEGGDGAPAASPAEGTEPEAARPAANESEQGQTPQSQGQRQAAVTSSN
ncbi:MAG: efflux RND transporter periplasmic adaptor subunit [Pseudomonadota bacterium]